MDNPKVSVVIPTYNRCDLLNRAIESISRQAYDNIELVIVDDDSTQDIELQHNLECELKYISHSNNRGAAAARNTGIKESTGKYIAFLDDDDMWKKMALSDRVQKFEESRSNVGAVYSGVEYRSASSTSTSIRSEEGDIHKELLLQNFIGGFSNIMIRNQVINKVGLINNSLPSWHDWEWYVRMSKHFNFECVEKPLTIWDQTTDREQITDDFESKHSTSIPKLYNFFTKEATRYNLRFVRKVQSRMFMHGAIAAARNGEMRYCSNYSKRSLLKNPLNYTSIILYLISFIGYEGFIWLLKIRRIFRNSN